MLLLKCKLNPFFVGSSFRLVADCDLFVRYNWASYALIRPATSANVEDKSPFEIRFGTVPQCLIPFFKRWYVEMKCQEKLRPNAFPRFSLPPRQNALVMPLKYFDMRAVLSTLATSHGRVYLFRPCFCRECLSCICCRVGRKIESKCRGGVVGEDVDFEELEQSKTEPSESTAVRSSFITCHVAPTPPAFLCRRAALAGERNTAVATSLGGATTEAFPGSLVEALYPNKPSQPCRTAWVLWGGGGQADFVSPTCSPEPMKEDTPVDSTERPISKFMVPSQQPALTLVASAPAEDLGSQLTTSAIASEDQVDQAAYIQSTSISTDRVLHLRPVLHSSIYIHICLHQPEDPCIPPINPPSPEQPVSCAHLPPRASIF